MTHDLCNERQEAQGAPLRHLHAEEHRGRPGAGFQHAGHQRESGEAYIAAQKHEGWVCLPDHYDDGGFTGGNMDRPALQRLLADIDAGQVDGVC